MRLARRPTRPQLHFMYCRCDPELQEGREDGEAFANTRPHSRSTPIWLWPTTAGPCPGRKESDVEGAIREFRWPYSRSTPMTAWVHVNPGRSFPAMRRQERRGGGIANATHFCINSSDAQQRIVPATEGWALLYCQKDLTAPFARIHDRTKIDPSGRGSPQHGR